jgi:hypothetical protein
MAWIEVADLRRTLASVLKLRDVNQLPDHWTPLAIDAVEEAYHTIRTALAARGYSPTQMDSWDSRRVFNRRVAVCIVFENASLPDDFYSYALQTACKAKEELADLVVTEGGIEVEPEYIGGNISWGGFVDDAAAYPNSIDTDTRL